MPRPPPAGGAGGALPFVLTGFTLSAAEVKTIVDNYGIANPYFPANGGPYLGGTKYTFRRGGGDDPIQFSKGPRGSESGGTIQMTGTCIIIGVYDDPSAAENVSEKISNMGMYLRSIGK